MKKLVLLLLCFASAAYGEIYTWKDARGTLFYTNSLYEIPSRYRSRAKLLDVATGKKKPISATPPGAQAGPAGAPGSPAPAQQPIVQQSPVQPPMAQPPPVPQPPPVAQAPTLAPRNPALTNPAPQAASPSAPPQRPIRRRVPRNQDE
jgi:hypothetical protein